MKIAVIGGGISGLSAALILSSRYEVSLFESEPRLGGHAHTVSLARQDSEPLHLDTGFLVYNTLTYPHLTRFLDYLQVPTAASEMTLSIKNKNGLEWCGTDLRTIFAQKRNFFRPAFWSLLLDIIRFNKDAQKNLLLSRENQWTLEDLLKTKGYGEDFQKLYLLPMTGAIWSMSFAKALQFPAETFLTFCINHHLLQINNRPQWRTIEGGSIQYVKKVHERLSRVFLSEPVRKVSRDQGKLKVSTDKSDDIFDKVIFATHAPTTRKMIQESFPELAHELSALQVTPNKVELHQDASVMPKNKICWAAWNVESKNSPYDESDICLTYYLNKLQPLKSSHDHFITLNSSQVLNKVLRELNYDHPQFDFAAIQVQKNLASLQGQNNLYFAGAWTRYGFHEDGILSAVLVAKLLGVAPPWENDASQ